MSEMQFTVPHALLDQNKMVRRGFLEEYFPSGLIPFERQSGSEWEITAFVPHDPTYYIDPNLEHVLERWQHPVSIETIGEYRAIYKNAMLSFFDSWSIYYWSILFAYYRSRGESFKRIDLLHVDDHRDVNGPLLTMDGREYTCLFTKTKVSILDPKSIKQAVISKSIGIDSFIAPLLASVEKIHIFHLRYAFDGPGVEKGIQLVREPDLLLSTGQERIVPQIRGDLSGHSYAISSEIEDFKSDSPILLHIDCDAFSNRYNLDSNWDARTATIDLGLSEIKTKIEEMMRYLSGLSSPIFMNIALSPGFFPSEYWQEVCDHLLRSAEECGIIKDDLLSHYISKHFPDEFRYRMADPCT